MPGSPLLQNKLTREVIYHMLTKSCGTRLIYVMFKKPLYLLYLTRGVRNISKTEQNHKENDANINGKVSNKVEAS